jgi:hypothetical protein
MVPRRTQGTSVTDIFDELNEDLRAEKARALATRYGIFGVAALVLVLAGVGAWQGWRWYQDREATRAALPYLAAMTQADALPPGPTPQRTIAADAFANVAATAPAGYRTLARLREAALLADSGNLPGALALYDAVAQDGAVDQILRDLATLLWAQHQIDQGDPAAIASRLKTIEGAGNPWRSLALEADALLALRRDDKDAAMTLLRALSTDTTAADGVRGRASGLLTLLGDTEKHG